MKYQYQKSWLYPRSNTDQWDRVHAISKQPTLFYYYLVHDDQLTVFDRYLAAPLTRLQTHVSYLVLFSLIRSSVSWRDLVFLCASNTVKSSICVCVCVCVCVCALFRQTVALSEWKTIGNCLLFQFITERISVQLYLGHKQKLCLCRLLAWLRLRPADCRK